jgi:hypothetical protein
MGQEEKDLQILKNLKIIKGKDWEIQWVLKRKLNS